MAKTHNLRFPRTGAHRELKFAQESYWKGQSSCDEPRKAGADLRGRRWRDQLALNLVPVGDFAFYDQALDMSFTLGNLPAHLRGYTGDVLDNYFRGARGRSSAGTREGALHQIPGES